MREQDRTLPKDAASDWDGAAITRELAVVPGPGPGPLARLGARASTGRWPVPSSFSRGARWGRAPPTGPSGARAARSPAGSRSRAACGLRRRLPRRRPPLWPPGACSPWRATSLGIALAAAGAAAALTSAWGPLGVRLANRLHRLVASLHRRRVFELRALPDRRAVAVRGVVIARRTAASALDGRLAVWSLTRFRRGAWLSADFFHEAAFDFLLDDGTDEPIWIEVAGGLLLDPFPPGERVQFHSTTLLEIEHPFLTRLRLDSREVLGAELTIAPGDVVEIVGRLSHRLDPTAPSASGRDQPQRRALRSGTRVPVMLKKLVTPDPELARVRRLLPKGPPSTSPGEPPIRKF